MNSTQSPYIPAKGEHPRWTDIPWLIRYSVRGLCELIRARFVFETFEASAIPYRNERSKAQAKSGAKLSGPGLARIGYVLPRLSDRLPWRSDCLIQAIAAQNWLNSLGAISEIQIGVERPAGGEFGAHAWLMHDGQVITGGEIDRYSLILADSADEE